MKAPLQRRLAARRALIGLLQTHHNPTLAELAGMCGYDFLLLDGEHGVFSDQNYMEALRSLAATDTLGMVRLGKHDPQALGRYLDMGADVIVVPNVSTAAQAKTLARAMEYPPVGTRGLGASLHRSTRYGMTLSEHLKAPQLNACLFVIVESAQGVANVDDILSVEGIDGVIIGPWDLTADLGRAGDFSQPTYAEAIARIEHAAASQAKLLGTTPHPGYSLESLLDRGHRLIILDDDISLIREAMTNQIAKARSIF